MRFLINYFKQCFCSHDWKIDELPYKIQRISGDDDDNTRVAMRCTKCGYHKKYWKY